MKCGILLLADDEIPVIEALGRQILHQQPELEDEQVLQSGSGLSVPLSDPSER